MRSNSFGFVFIEIIISIALISIVFITLLGIGALVLNVSASVQKETQADSLIKEEFEAVRNFRDGTTWAANGLGTASTGSGNPYHLVNNANKWTLVAGPETVGKFTRKVVFDKVSRDPTTQNIEYTYNQSHDDANTRKATVTITWTGRTLQDISYFTNWK